MNKVYPTLDGPAHLYNSNLLKEIISGNDFIKGFLSLNSIYNPNWTGHVILMGLRFLFPGWLAEKLFIIGYVSGMALSFRYFVYQFNKKNSCLSLLIYPFIYSFLFRLGFFNFNISFIFFFLTLGYYHKTLHQEKAFNYMMLFLLFTITYFSNLLIYSLLGLSAGILALSTFNTSGQNTTHMYNSFKPVLRKLLFLLAITLPSLILMLLFFKHTPFSTSKEGMPMKELLIWLKDARPFIIFNFAKEEIYTRKLVYMLIVFLAVNVFKKIAHRDRTFSFRTADILLIPASISLVMLFTIPNASGAGMMSDRFALMFFIFLVAWVAIRTVYSRLNYILILYLLVIHVMVLNHHHKGTSIRLIPEAQSIYETADFIDSNSIVLPINMTGNWFQVHHSNYLGTDKPLFILENYEANVGWFPLKWYSTDFPNILLGEKHQISGVMWKTNIHSSREYQVDYLFLYGDLSKLENEEWRELKMFLLNKCTLIYESDDAFVRLFKRHDLFVN
ncbi:MAG: hypothetical protein V2B15_10420 [Bacteroidota bacterium]